MRLLLPQGVAWPAKEIDELTRPTQQPQFAPVFAKIAVPLPSNGKFRNFAQRIMQECGLPSNLQGKRA
jgi:hypothetical protein